MAEMWVEESEVSTTPGIPVLPARYAELRAELLRAVRRRCPGWLADEAEDFVQESLIRLFQRNQRADGNLSVTPAYLRKVAYCAIVDEMRRRRRRVDTDTFGDEANVEALADDAPDRQHGSDIGAAISECLAHQNADRRRAVTLHLLGHSVPEAAAILGSNSKRTENLVYRGLAQLRDCLTRRGLKP